MENVLIGAFRSALPLQVREGDDFNLGQVPPGVHPILGCILDQKGGSKKEPFLGTPSWTPSVPLLGPLGENSGLLGSQMGPKMVPKWVPKATPAGPLGSPRVSQGIPKGSQKGPQNASKWGPKIDPLL